MAAKDESQKAKNPEEQYCSDVIDQKTFTSDFTGKESHSVFREDIRTETLTAKTGLI